MDENTNFLNKVVAEIVSQLECIEDLLTDDGRFDRQVYMCEEFRIAVEDQLEKIKGGKHGN
jgi:hypothetical protein